MIQKPKLELFSLLYVSYSRLTVSGAPEEARKIVDTSMKHNARQGITGALLFTGAHFAQILEGDKSAVVELMTAISSDARHDRIIITKQCTVGSRLFPNWSLAYFGPSGFVSDHVSRVLDAHSPAEKRQASRMLEALITEFAGSGVKRR